MKKINLKIKVILFIVISTKYCGFSQNSNWNKPKGEQNINFVPDSATAVKIAEVIWLPIYGKEIEKKKPYKAKLINDTTWSVQSSSLYLHGDVYVIEINKKNGHIYYVAHEK